MEPFHYSIVLWWWYCCTVAMVGLKTPIENKSKAWSIEWNCYCCYFKLSITKLLKLTFNDWSMRIKHNNFFRVWICGRCVKRECLEYSTEYNSSALQVKGRGIRISRRSNTNYNLILFNQNVVTKFNLIKGSCYCYVISCYKLQIWCWVDVSVT